MVALSIELKTVKMTEKASLYSSVFMKNFINNFTYMDTLIVLMLSVIIGSFLQLQILGGVLVVAGVIVIALTRE